MWTARTRIRGSRKHGIGGGADGQRGAAGIGSAEGPVDRVTKDGSYSAHFEHCIAVTENGPWVLTRP